MLHKITSGYGTESVIKALKAGDTLEVPLTLSLDPSGNYATVFIGDGIVTYPEIAKMTAHFVMPENYNMVNTLVGAIDQQIETLAETYHREVGALREKKAQLLQISYGGNDILDANPAPQPTKENDDDFPF